MAIQHGGIENLLKLIETDPSVPADIKLQARKLTGDIEAASALRTDVWIYRAVVVVLGVTVLATIMGGLGLAFKGDLTNFKLPSEIVAIGSAAVGALAGLLAPSPKDNG
ncbi:hypothetical protein [Bradyrhizobium elkanii]|uniref:Uncharacterized protein n=1 Tax=Bradyrhizobium elkanii TaxID=29448 RepID=A0A8I1YJF0_BRAEL|nr:hypothetical protein [Bradyrhizobium elkanii]MBP1299775.1 hypothetical protein [Bradyrhizobium elkanii]